MSSTRSIAAQIKTSVSGLSAATANTPSATRVREPAQLNGVGKFGRTAEVIRIASPSVTRLNTNSQEIPSATNVGDWEKMLEGCQLASCKLIGNWICQTKTLTHANS